MNSLEIFDTTFQKLLNLGWAVRRHPYGSGTNKNVILSNPNFNVNDCYIEFWSPVDDEFCYWSMCLKIRLDSNYKFTELQKNSEEYKQATNNDLDYVVTLIDEKHSPKYIKNWIAEWAAINIGNLEQGDYEYGDDPRNKGKR